MQNSSGIREKVVVITGASSGIGEATALLLAERGAKVVLGARGLDRLEALAARIAASGGEVAYARMDVRRREDVSNLVGLAIERYGKLDVLVNNAGVAPISLLDELPRRRLGGDDRRQPQRRSVRHRRRVAGVPPAEFRTSRKCHFYGRNSNHTYHGGLCWHEERRAHDHRDLATGSRR
jgi:NAD(P)-dependent dehydrogenase (short-subunit alcohol dehydrogenase family)